MFSLRALMVAVAYAAVAAAALINRTPLWASAIITLTVALAVAATIAACFVPAARTFYGPFAGVVWLYLAVLFLSPLNNLERSLIPSQLVFKAWGHLHSDIDYPPEMWERAHYESTANDSLMTFERWQLLVALNAVYNTVHCVTATLLGALAGFLTVLATKHKRAETNKG